MAFFIPVNNLSFNGGSHNSPSSFEQGGVAAIKQGGSVHAVLVNMRNNMGRVFPSKLNQGDQYAFSGFNHRP